MEYIQHSDELNNMIVKRHLMMRRIVLSTLLAVIISLCYMPILSAETSAIYIEYDKKNKTHLKYVAAIKYELKNKGFDVSYIESGTSNTLLSKNQEEASLYISVGVDAAKHNIANGENKPTLFGLIPLESLPEEAIQNQLKCNPRCIFSVLDQPLKRKMDLLRHALPGMKRVGVLYDSHSEVVANELASIAPSTGYRFKLVKYNKEYSLLQNLSPVLKESDLLFAIPDPNIYNRRTARSIILTTYRNSIPIFGYSETYTRAGALLSLHSSPKELAQQDVEIIIDMLNNKKVTTSVVYPKYYSVSINQTVAKSLQLHLQSADELTTWLRNKDGFSSKD